MTTHTSHRMQDTSLMNYIPFYSDQIIDQHFRQKVKADLIKLLQTRKNMTDREMAASLGFADPNKVRPRRNELAKGKKDREGEIIEPSLVSEDCQRVCAIGGKISKAWKLNEENLRNWVSRE